MTQELLRTALLSRLSTEPSIETAALAGYYARLGADRDPLLDRVPRLGAPALIPAAAAALERIELITEADGAEAAWAALGAMQDVVAAAEHGDAVETIEALVDEAAAAVRAFPEGWVAVADRAVAVLDHMSGSRASGAARRLWSAVEASVEPVSVHAGDHEVPLAAAVAAGIVPEIRLRLAARDGRIAAPCWDVLASTVVDAWVVTEDDQGPILLFAGPTVPRVRHDGAEVTPLPHPEGGYLRLRPGVWELRDATGAVGNVAFAVHAP
jgi:hypothetical protein